MSRAREQYEAHIVQVLSHVWRKNGDFLEVEPAEMETPLTAVLEGEAGSTRVDPDWLPSDMQDLRTMDREELLGLVLNLVEERDGVRQQALRVMMDFFFSRGPEPLLVLELVFMMARVMHKDHAWRMRPGEMAAMLGRSKQDWQNIEERVIEELVRRWTRAGFVIPGGKSYSARERYSHDKQGNTSRKRGKRRGDEMPSHSDYGDDGEPRLSKAARARAERMRQEAERRELAQLCGCKPEDIDLKMITPKH